MGSSRHREEHSKAAYGDEIDDGPPPDQLVDPADGDDDDVGTGRPYECMFCRRGFSSAQALGGHMNIHRRDRARIGRQPPPPVEEAYYRPAAAVVCCPPAPSEQPPRAPYGMYFFGGPSSTTLAMAAAARPASAAQDRGVAQWERRRELRMFGGDLHLGLGASGDGKREDGRRRDGEEDGGGLDLELRLGHEP